ncbi:uncharacterized protein [Halyomorpha halys]|uniref:uncharacterized protein isoform X1 n=2 Tax=Halyomorpha halys TaxID=286706 RepID=UPI0006D50647|nr:uncharacterized protein LOC106679488 isoform X1 [Halyomorpha halys]XP_024218887.1 uncharacterized protein LOC106679488 isoform X1 [Halyomorpha halys]XP_024218888.1 uncharacterized protein LOC106679488 isoform X1 [Halyomorpha halys]XP_024218889.1 uncharacterized protein LOC106679488 isoform X1 [Halyomorpha halys]XP_024218890.1 uncharacterized protein LOC106679488 isoform X1 [Halyomorpha halys]XP_024218891.1 uncharacterized protein LOC106679488 isoform X1 [Halyomorpha halys]
MTETLDTVQSSDFNEKETMEDGQASSQFNEDSQEISSVDTVAKPVKQMDNESTDISREEDSRSDSGVCSPSSSTDLKKQGNGSIEMDKIVIKPEDGVELPKTPETDNENWEKEATPTPEDNHQRPVISVRKSEDLFGMVNGSNEQCSVCNEKFTSPSALEQHRATAGHYNCSLQECLGLSFQTATELSEHQAIHHQPPVQQLAQQVQRIPATFNAQSSYRPSTTPPVQRYGSVPQTIGSGVVLSPVNPTSSVPNLPPGIQLSKRPASQPAETPVVKQRREENSQPSHIRLPDSITLVSRTPTQPTPQQRQRESVTDMLANRGITVVPSGRSQPVASNQPVLTRQLNSAISITPSSQHRAAGFISPAPKAPMNKLPTVDLTKESDTPRRRTLNRGVRMCGPTGRSICQICDKAFPTPSELSQHMVCHRGGGMANKLAYECRECTAQYPTEAGLQAHRQKYHGAGGPSPDMAIPIVDLKQVGVLSRLAALGIRSVIPLAQLHSGSGGGMFGLPVVAVDSASNPAICNIGGMGASNLLPLGPLKNLTFNNNMR